MAIVKMRRVIATMYNGDREKFMKLLVRLGVVDIVPNEELDLPTAENEQRKQQKEELNSKLARLSFAIDFLKQQRKAMQKYVKEAPKGTEVYAPPRYVRPLLEVQTFESIAEKEQDLFEIVSQLENYNAQLLHLNSESIKGNVLLEQLKIYSQIDVPFNSFKDTKYTSSVLGFIPNNNLTQIPSILQQFPFLCLESYISTYGGNKVCVACFCPIEEKPDMMHALQDIEFTKCTFEYDNTPETEIKRTCAFLEDLQLQKKQIVHSVVGLDGFEEDLCTLYDYINMEMQKLTVEEDFAVTQSTFSISGWLPSTAEESFKKEIEESQIVAEMEFRDPLDTELPPTCTKNTRFASQFEGITSMFGAPNYRERDPNFFVAIFYFLFFGIMISDAGYGLLMAIACFLFIKITKPKKNSGKMIIMFGLCGVATVIWGALFGGWFAITLPEGSFLDRITLINPLNEPLKLFVLSLGMGILQIGTGFALKGIDTIKQGGIKNILSGILNQFSWVSILFGLLCLFPKLMIFLSAISIDPQPAWFGVMAKIGLYFAIIGLVMLVLGGMVGKKNPIKMVAGAFGNLYGGINVMSDLVSYSRLFGLGLTTGVIGYVINMLATIIVNVFCGGAWWGWIPASVLLVVGHLFNLGINLLGAYVHDSRLQYIEFFGRFYEGSGRAYVPFGTKTKYVYLDNEKI